MAKKLYSVVFTVEGRGQFPFDMLRYDCCFPTSGDDAAKLDRDELDRHVVRKVRLASWARLKHWHPTVDRWSSFGWAVTPNSINVSPHWD